MNWNPKVTPGIAGVVVVLAVIAFILFAVSRLPPYMRRSPDTECKANLHNIQLSIERYGVDHGAAYPPYLIGGAAGYSVAADAAALDRAALTDVNPALVSDPLLREGYITQYPRNPFLRDKRDRAKLYDLQAALATSITGDDPLRNGPGADGGLLGTRFGAKCDLMGQVLCDARAEKFSYMDSTSGKEHTADSWAIVEYRAWDIWEGNRSDPTKQLLPGQFFYKAIGPYIYPVGEGEAEQSEPPDVANEHLSLEGEVLRPPHYLNADMYIMGVYGGPKTKGKDVLGEETLGIWTRSTYSASRLDGSCYLAVEHDGTAEIQYGDPNGIRDGLIFILTAGEDYIGER